MKNVNVLNLMGSLMLGLATNFAFMTIVDAQEPGDIVIVNPDGEQVQASEIQRVQPGSKGIQENAGPTGGTRIKVKGNIQHKGGKWVVTDAEGNEQEIDIQGAQSIIINQAVESVDEDGENKTKRVGKAIIVGPDGKRHEIELGGSLMGGAAEFDMPGFNGIMSAQMINNSFMIGVNCKPASEAMRAQLGLDADEGLVVLNVSKDSPAEVAGVEKHDILMFADGTQLVKQSDLVEVVQQAGKEKSKVSLTAIRAGKEVEIDVSPVERPESMTVHGISNLFKAFPDGEGRGFNMQFRQMGPGLIVGEDMENDFQIEFENEMKEMEARMDELRKQMEEQMQEQLNEKDKN